MQPILPVPDPSRTPSGSPLGRPSGRPLGLPTSRPCPDCGVPLLHQWGRVLKVLPAKNRLIVEGVNMIKRHTRPNPQRNIKGGIVEREASLHASNVQLVCPECSWSRCG